MPFSPFCRSTLQKFLDFSHKTSSVFLEKRVRSSKSDRSACEPHRHKLAIARNEEEYNSIEIGAILQYADEQIEVVGKRYERLLYNSYAEPTGEASFSYLKMNDLFLSEKSIFFGKLFDELKNSANH